MAIPVKPRTADNKATTKKMRAHRNMIESSESLRSGALWGTQLAKAIQRTTYFPWELSVFRRESKPVVRVPTPYIAKHIALRYEPQYESRRRLLVQRRINFTGVM